MAEWAVNIVKPYDPEIVDAMDTPLVFAYSHGTREDTYVTYSDQDSAAEMTRYPIGKGHRRIGVIAGHPHSYPAARRMHGIQMAMQQAGLVLPAENIRYGEWEYESSATETRSLLELPQRPTAIFAMNDLPAAGCMRTLNEAGLRIPQDIAVVGFDNREIASYLQPPLTTIQLPTMEIGVRAVMHLLDMIQNPAIPPMREVLHCSIAERDSV